MTFTDLPPLERRRLAREYRTWTAANRAAGRAAAAGLHAGAGAPCGTAAGYQRHLGDGEMACYPCRLARSDYMRERRRT